ncbi:MAG: DUF1302 family protein [Panacagrimonas sp.]
MKTLNGLGAAAATAACMLCSTAFAQSDGNYDFLGGSLSFNGLVRVETSINTSDQANRFNQFGDPANGVAIRRAAGNPATQYRTTLVPTGLNPLTDLLGGFTPIVTGPAPLGVSNSTVVADTFTRYVPAKDPDLNYHLLRFEVSPTLDWGGGWSFQSRFRAVYDPGKLGYNDFSYGDYADVNGGIDGGDPSLYHGSPNFLGYRTDDDRNPLLFERSGKHYMVDAPAFFLQWTNGNITARLGNQTVAWGQLLFFRIMDQANGLDLRRHLFLDRALEEYADERQSAPGLRVTWQATDRMTADFFAQQFIPTIVPNTNTPYNVVDTHFTLHDRYTDGGYNEKLNFGVRLKAEYGNFSWQAMYTNKLDQLGRIRFRPSGVNKKLPESNELGLVLNRYCEVVLASPLGQGCGPQLAQLPFEVVPAGLHSAEEWFWGAPNQKLDPVGIFNGIIDDFAPLPELLTLTPNGDVNQISNQLNLLFMASEGLRGHIERDYFREDVFGLGAGYVTEGEPGSIFDQIIINVEAAYTPGRLLTSPDVRTNPPEVDDLQIGLVAEKYQRFSDSFPATYLVFQYLWSKETDLAGLRIDGYGAEQFSTQNQGIRLDKDVPLSDNPRSFRNGGGGVHNANYVVFAFLQPTDAYIWEYSAAALIDVQGGILVQPAVQWKPRGNVTVNLFYNYINDSVWGDNSNRNTLSLVDFANEVNIRIGYQF